VTTAPRPERPGPAGAGRGHNVAAAIIAGGQGKRLGGTNKGALLIAGRSILERQIEVLRPRFSRLLLVCNQDADFPTGVTQVKDRVPPGQGPLAGLDAALAALLPDETAVVCVGGDMPLLVPALLEGLRDTAPAATAVVARVGQQAQPLLARYSRACAPAIAAALAAHAFKTSDVLAQFAVHWLDEPALRALDPTLASLQNVNTPEDLQRLALLAQAHDNGD
jgi:molybdenum cofactor guanylyltransferase